MKMTRLQLIPTVLAVGALAAACGDESTAPPEPTTVTVSPAAVELAALQSTTQLRAEVRDQHGQVMNVPWAVWSSGDAKVASVDSAGLVTAVANGSTSVTASVGGVSGSAAVTVAQKVASVSVSPAADTVPIGDTLWLAAKALDANGHAIAGAAFVWASSDPQVAVVDDAGLVTAVADGTVEVTATSAGVTGRAALAVEDARPVDVAMTPDTVLFTALGQTAQMTAEVQDQGGNVMADVAVTWASGDTTIVAVDSTGLATAVGSGEATVIAEVGSVSGAAAVVVLQVPQSLSVSAGEGRVGVGDTLRLVSAVLDGNGHPIADPSVTWSSSDASVATVDPSGLVLGVKVGSATITASSGDVEGSSEITVENPDRAVLVALYEATNGPSWINSASWLTDAPLGQWYGVDTDEQGRVVRVNLAGTFDYEARRWRRHGLSGPIPPELGGLAKLRSLDLHANDLTGPIPLELASLVALESLSLNNNGLTGPIPPELGNMAGLEYMRLHTNNLQGPIPPELGNLRKLKSLSLGQNGRLEGAIPSELGQLLNLEHLDLRANGYLTGPVPPNLAKLTKLVSLDLSYNPLTGQIPPELGGLANLVFLSFVSTDLTGPIPRTFLNLHPRFFGGSSSGLCLPGTSEFVEWVDALTSEAELLPPFCNESDRQMLGSLYELTDGRNWINSTGWLRGPVLEEWHGVQADSGGRVTGLHLSSNGLSGNLPVGIGSLTQMTSLWLDGNSSLAGRVPWSLMDLDLKDFHYGETRLCLAADGGFRDWLAGVQSHAGTGIECPALTDRSALAALYAAAGGSGWRQDRNWLSEAPLGRWHGVEVDDQGRVVGLELQNNRLSGLIPPELGGLVNLAVLNLAWNDLGGAIPERLGRLGNLQRLHLNGNALTGPVPPELGGLGNLTSLSLGHNDLSGPIPAELAGLANLRWLYLNGNGLTGSIPPELGNLANLQTLDLDWNGLGGTIPPELGDLANLYHLQLRNNDLVGEIPTELGNLGTLLALYLDRNGLSGLLPSELGALTRLQHLTMAYNHVSGPIPVSFGALSTLRRLDISHNEAMTGPLPDGLTSATNLEELLASGTDLCAPTHDDFRRWLVGVRKLRVPSCGQPPAAYLVQAVQSRDFPVPLVAGETALLRVFPTARAETAQGIPPVRARFYVGGREIHVEDIPGKPVPIPTRVDEGSLRSSAAAEIPARVVRPGLHMVIEIDPDGTLDPALGVVPRIPAEGRLPVDVRAMPVLDLTLIPFVWTGGEDSSIVTLVAAMAGDPESHELLENVRTLLPVGDMAVRAHERVMSKSNNAYDLLSQTIAIRVMEGGKGYYMGMLAGPRTGGASGVAALGYWSSFSAPSAFVIAHELGHNMNLLHAPCGARSYLDSSFPDRYGSVAAWGYDSRGGRLVPPFTPDQMSYCGPPWISDYHFTNALNFRLHNEGTAGDAFARTPAKSLLLWGGADADGHPFLNPAFVVDAPPALPEAAGDYTLAGRSADGRELFSLSFVMLELAAEEDAGSTFVFALPVRPEWADALTDITLSSPEHSVTLSAASDLSMAILRDPRTGQVRGFLRDVADPDSVQADAVAGIAPGARLDVLFSRGLPDRAAWRR